MTDIAILLIGFTGAFMSGSFAIYAWQGDERWFSRLALAVIALGISEILRELQRARQQRR